MQLNAKNKSVTYSIDALSEVEDGLNEIEKTALENDSVSSGVARSLCTDLNHIRDTLRLKRGVTRHKKWTSEFQQPKAEYSEEYVQALEKVAQQMVGALEEAASIIDESKMALVNPKHAEKSMNTALERYHAINRDFAND